MNNLEMVFNWTKKLEAALKMYGAEGQGLIQYTQSLESSLPYDLSKELKDIGWVRNKLAHEEGFEMQNSSLFEQRCIKAFARLDPQFVPNARKALEAIDKIIKPVTGPETGPQSRIYATSRLVTDELAADLLQIMERANFGNPAPNWVNDPDQFKQLCNKTYTALVGEFGTRRTASKPTIDNAAPQEARHTPAGNGNSLLTKIVAVAAIFLLSLTSFYFYAANQKIDDEMKTTLSQRNSVINDLKLQVKILNGALSSEQDKHEASTQKLKKTIAVLELEMDKQKQAKHTTATTGVRKAAPRNETPATATPVNATIKQTAEGAKASQSLSFGALTQSKKDKDAAEADIQHGFFERFGKNLQVTLGETTYNVKGKTVDIVVPVIWKQPEGNSFVQLLNKYFQSSDGQPLKYQNSPFFSSDRVGLEINKYCNSGDKFRQSYSESLYNLMTSKKIVIRISAGSYSSKLTIAGSLNDTYWVQFYGGPKIKSLSYEEKNPVIIKNVPIEEAKNIKSVAAEVIVM